MKLVLLTLTSVLIFSCAEYQYLTVESDNIPKNSNNDLKKTKQSELTLEIAEAIKEVNQMQKGEIKPLSLDDI